MKSSTPCLPWRLSVALFFSCLVFLAPASAIPQEAVTVPFEITGRTMGPIAYKVVIADHPKTVSPVELQERVAEVLENVNQLMSTYQPDSDVSRFNRSKSVEFQPVDPKTAAVVARSLEISKQTGEHSTLRSARQLICGISAQQNPALRFPLTLKWTQ